MSFIKTLATLAIGFAAARGVDRYHKMGGMPGVKDALKKASEPGGAVDDLGRAAERWGLPGGADAVRDMARRAGTAAETGLTAAEAGFGNLMRILAGAAGSAGQAMSGAAATFGGASGVEMSEANAKLLIRAMIEAAKADGTIDTEERSRIMEFLAGATPEEREFVEAALAAPADLAGLVADVSEGMKAQVYATARMTMRADNPAESAWLDQLAAGLGLDPDVRARLDAGGGAA